MCGIAGFVAGLPLAEPGRVLTAMLDAVAHRGPDGRGVAQWNASAATVAVGAVRLSLLDLAGGHQPMVGPDGSTALVFNGEITNHHELRRRHLRDHQFASRSDTETLLALWARLGPDCVSHLEGMFAFVVASGDQVWLARDRAGIKPLFLHTGGSTLSFASETKAFFTLPWFTPDVDARTVVEHAVFGHPLDGRTWWKDVVELDPGTVLHVTVEAYGAPRVESKSFVAPARPAASSVDDSPEALQAVLEGSIARHLVSDHPSGVFLSGGLDSTVIASVAARVRDRSGAADRLHAFTFGDSPALADMEAARLVARTLGTEHHETIVSFDDVTRALVDNVRSAEQPMTDIGASLVMGPARRHVKSALVGEGSDELLAGYWPHREPLAYVRGRISAFLRCYRHHGDGHGTPLFEPLGQALARLALGGEEERRRQVRQFFLESPLRHMHLHRWDHTAMAASLEVRVPYLSAEVYEHVDAVMAQRPPMEWGDKEPLREMARRVLPVELVPLVTERPKVAAPSNFAGHHRRLAQYAATVVPDGHLAAHPLRHCTGGREPSALGVMLLDLFLWTFAVHRGHPPVQEGPTALYGRPAELELLREVLEGIDLPANLPPLDDDDRALARRTVFAATAG